MLTRLLRRPGAHQTATLPEYRQYEIGAWTYGCPTVEDWRDGTTLKIGKYCSIASSTIILLGGEHDPRCVTTYPIDIFMNPSSIPPGGPVFPTSKGDVVIGHDVHIGTGCLILSGVRIGNGAVIGAGSVVTQSVPAYAIAVGNPAKVLKYRFELDIIARLESLAWWDWPDDKVREAQGLLLSHDVTAFLARYEAGDPQKSPP
jgi:acetyltransferase-like isoleucine patch superfamily enzyme